MFVSDKKQQKIKIVTAKMAFGYTSYFLFLKINTPLQNIRTLAQKVEIYLVLLKTLSKFRKFVEVKILYLKFNKCFQVNKA